MNASWVIVAILELSNFNGFTIDAYIFDFKFNDLKSCSSFLKNNIVKLEKYIKKEEGIKAETFICLEYNKYFTKGNKL
tara:strand:- start:1512 stop:1745 length:234 start_codon:yes stop_codon:yes gene_type:complete